MNFDVSRFSCAANSSEHNHSKSYSIVWNRDFIALLLFSAIFQLAGCVSDKVDKQSDLTFYQRAIAEQGPQHRIGTEGRNTYQSLGLLKPTAPPTVMTDPNTGQKTVLASGTTPPGLLKSEALAANESDIKLVTDPNTGKKSVSLTIEQAIARTLANSSEIRVVSFDPSIAKQDITKTAAEFDLAFFGSYNYEDEANPPNSIFQPGESDVRTVEYGFKQKGVTGSEWSLSYVLTRSWDDLVGRTLPIRYEPILGFQIKQPLLRDAWEDVSLADVNIARLNYRIALFGFREKAEDIAAQVISGYWRLLQARRDFEIQGALLGRTLETLKKVKNRKEIDATDVQIKQTEASAKAREAALLQANKEIIDAQNTLVRLMLDPQLSILDEFEIIPVSEAALDTEKLDSSEILEIAMKMNPAIQRAKIETEIADINIRVAENQDMPRLDLVASARTQALTRDRNEAQDRLETGEYDSYAIGLSLEYPLGNRQRHAELLKRRLERRRAISALQNVADQVAILAKEGITRIETYYSEIQIQKEAAEAARIHLQALEDSEPIRERLTPEFLMVKLQAQEALANSQRSEIRAIVEFNVSLVQLAQISGTIMELHQVSTSLPGVSDSSKSE
ncbi:TolC family protein [Planctomycetota bacterium]